MSRRYTGRFQCGHPGCREIANYEFSTRREQGDGYGRYGDGKWKCWRHTRLDEVLSNDRPHIVAERKSIRRFTDSGSDIGLYWNGVCGSISGPGFKAFTEDFPEGTILRVTAEIILPAIAKTLSPSGTESE